MAYVTVVKKRNMEIIATRPVVLSVSLPVINKVEAVSVYLDGRGQHAMVDIQTIFCVLTLDYAKGISCFRLTLKIILGFPVTL